MVSTNLHVVAVHMERFGSSCPLTELVTDKYRLLTKPCSVKMAGYWPSSVSACLSTDIYSSQLDQTSLVNK